MIDPVSAMALASGAFTLLKKGVGMGKELEEMTGLLGKWFAAVADIRKAEEESSNPPMFRKVLFANSVEKQALQNLLFKKKIQQQERELRELIVYRFGVDTYKEMMRDRQQIRDTRERMAEMRSRKIKHLTMNTMIIMLALLIVTIPIFLILIIIDRLSGA
jgi:hypothetical protein